MKKSAYLINDDIPSSENVVWMIKLRRWLGKKIRSLHDILV